MLRRSKRLIVTGLIAAGATTLIPAAPIQAMAPCQVRDVAKIQEWSHEALVTGQYAVPDAVEVRLTCGIVQSSGSVIRITDKAAGPVAALAQLTSIQGQNYTVCHEITIQYAYGSETIDTCP